MPKNQVTSMNRYLERHELPQVTQEGINNLALQHIKRLTQYFKSSTKKSPGSDDFTG